MKPGGKIFVKTGNMSNPFSLRLRYIDFTHEVGFTEESFVQVLYIAGFLHGQCQYLSKHLLRKSFIWF